MDIQFGLLFLGSKYLETRNISLTSMTWQQFSRSSQIAFLIRFFVVVVVVVVVAVVWFCFISAHCSILTLFSLQSLYR